MMVESYTMWMGMDLLVSKDEKESLSAIMWFEVPESIKSALDFEVLAIRESYLFHVVVPDLADLSSERFLEY